MFTFLKEQLKKRNTNILVISILLLIVAGSFLVNYFFFNNIEEASAWYSDNWLYRQGIPITNSGAERENYQVAITVDTATLISAGKMQSMCQDIRFTSKITGKELPYWIESGCNSASTKIWVNVDKLPYSASATYPTVDMYYGNPTAPKGENGDETFLFFDDFNNDLSKWEIALRDTTVSPTLSTSTVQITDSGSVRLAPSNSHHASANIISQERFTNGIIIEARRKQDVDSYYVTFSLGGGIVQNDEGGENDWYQTFKANGYAWNRHQEATHTDNMISEIGPGVFDATLKNNIATVNSGTYARYQYIYESSGDLWWFINDNYVGSATDTTYLTTEKNLMFTQGEFNAGYGAPQDIDWVFVRKYGEQENEPTMGTAQAEEQGKGAVGYWKFDEGYGSITYDSSGQGNHGTITGATWKNEEECVSGKCLFFEDNEYSDLGDVSQLEFASGDFSVSAWIKLRDLMDGSPNDNYEIVSNESNLVSGWLFRVGNASGGAGRLYLRTSQNSASTDAQSTSGHFTSNKWYHVVAVNSGGIVTFYIDGVVIPLLDDGVITSPAAGSATFRLGGRSQEMEGYIDEVKIYPYARTADEVKADYLGGLQGMSASIGKSESQRLNDGLVGHWKMDEIAGWSGVANEVVDSSGAGNHGVRVGDATTTSTAKYGMSGGFDGTGDYVTIGDIGSVKTISFWLNNSNATDGILELVNNDTYISIASNVITATNFTSPTIYIDGIKTTAISSGWHFVAITTDTAISAASVVIGEANTDEMTGQIDDVRVYNRALSAREAFQLYETGPPPVLHLKMDEKIGTNAYDTSSNSNNGSFSGSPLWKNGSECVRGSCLDFNGTDAYLTVADANTLDIKSAITLSAWVKPRAFDHPGGGGSARIFDKNNAFEVYVTNTGSVTVTLFGLSDTSLATTNLLSLNKWTHIAVTYDQHAAVKKIYFDGVEVESEVATGELVITGTAMYLGDNGGGTRLWDGAIDDARIYNYALTDRQIAQIMQSGANAVSNRATSLASASANEQISGGPILYYDFENSGVASTSDYTSVRSLIYDKSGRGNHGIAYNATSTPGKFGRALGLAGNSDCVDMPGFSSTSQTYTFSMWMNNGDVGTINKYILDFQTGRFIIGLSSTADQIGFSDGLWKTFGNFPEDGIWHHYVWLFDSANSEAKLYIDGSQFGATQAYVAKNLTGNMKIGGHNTTCTSEIDVNLDEFKIYEYLLTEAEIKQDYNKGKILYVAPAQNPSITSAASGNHPGGEAPILHLTFDEGSGTTSTDRSGNGNDGGRGEGIAAPIWKGAGYCKKGGCLDFDGTDDFVSYDDIDFGSAMSGSIWVKFDTIPGTARYLIASTATIEYELQVQSDGTFRIRVDAAGGNGITDSSTVVETNKWYHIVFTYDGSDTKMYINGLLESTNSDGTGSGAIDDNADILYVGKRSDGGEVDGVIDEVKIWNRALTPAEVAYEYNGGKPFGHWKFDEGNGDWAYDSSGNGNHGYVVIGENVINTTSTAWQNGASGVFNAGLELDGNDDYIKIVSDYNSETVSFSGWFNTDTISSNQWLINRYQDGSDEWGLRVATGIGLSIYDDIDNQNETVYGALVNAGQWYHFVATINPDLTQNLYVDGELVGSGDLVSDGGDSFSGNLFIGQRGDDSSTKFNGKIDDFRIYNYALNATQVKQIYNNGKALYFK